MLVENNLSFGSRVCSGLLLIFLGFVSSPSLSWATVGRLISAQTSNEQDVFRLELLFDQLIDTNKVGMQFQGKSLILSVPEFENKKILSPLESKSTVVSNLKILNTKEKTMNIEIVFSEINALQMKENIALEGLGKSLIIEVLPPLWNKTNPSTATETKAPVIEHAVPAAETPKNSSETTQIQSADKNMDESKVPLFEKKTSGTKESSEVSKIIFTVIAIMAMGGYLIWFLKKKSKMVNGPESVMKIKMITQFHLGPKKSLAVIRVAGESLLLGITDSDIRLIKTLSLLDEDLPELTPENFSETLIQQDQKPSKKNLSSDFERTTSEEEFSFGPAVKTNLSQKIPLLRKII